MIRIFVLYISLLLPLAVCAEGVTYRTQFIESAIRTLKLTRTVESLPCGFTTLQYRGKTLCVNVDRNHEMDYIGIPLFSKQQRHLQPSPIYDYLEFAYMKYKFSIPGDLDNFRFLHFVEGSWADMDAINDSTMVSIKNVDGKSFEVEWELNNKNIRLEFPIRYDMISNSNHLEMENNFIKDLKRAKGSVVYKEQKRSIKDLHSENLYVGGNKDTLYVEVGDTLFTSRLSSSKYYKVNNDSLSLIYDEAYPMQSLANALLTGWATDNREITLDIRKMDFSREECKVNLGSLLKLLKQQGYENYVNIKERDGKTSLSLYSYNPDLGCINLFIIGCQKTEAVANASPLKAKVFLYIPVSNIKNLFYDKQH